MSEKTYVEIYFTDEELCYIRRALDVCINHNDSGLDANKLEEHLQYIQNKIDMTRMDSKDDLNCVFSSDEISNFEQSLLYLRDAVISYNNNGHNSAINIDIIQAICDKLNNAIDCSEQNAPHA